MNKENVLAVLVKNHQELRELLTQELPPDDRFYISVRFAVLMSVYPLTHLTDEGSKDFIADFPKMVTENMEDFLLHCAKAEKESETSH